MLVKVENEKHVCELKTVAEYFGKRHADLIRDIKNLINNKADLSSEFVHTTELDAQGKPRPTYHLTQKGFTILCMCFKGAKALELKCKFYDEFERLRNENILHNQYLQLLGDRNDNTVCISDVCCKFKDLAPNVANNMLIEWDIITHRASGYYPNFDYLNGGYLISATIMYATMVIDKFKEVGYEIQ